MTSSKICADLIIYLDLQHVELERLLEDQLVHVHLALLPDAVAPPDGLRDREKPVRGQRK